MAPPDDGDPVTPGVSDPDDGLDIDVEEDVWPFLSDRFLNEWAPGVLQAQNAWMASIDSLREPDRKTHELIRMVCTVVARQLGGVQRHARLAAEVGATWDEIVRVDPPDRARLRDRAGHSGHSGRPARLSAGRRRACKRRTTGSRWPNDARVIVGHAPRP